MAKLYSFGYYLLVLIGISLISLQAAPLDINAIDREWQVLFDEMHAVERVATSFEESRTFAFRKAPKLYRGVFRKEADGRVSLAYTEPEAIALHIGDGFAYYRKGEGRVRRIPNSNSQSGALAIFPQLLNFDLIALAGNYEISGDIEGGVWHLSFVADEDSSEDLPYQSMRVDGRGTAVRRIELSKSQKQAVVIEMQDPVYPDFYLPEIKAQYFFRPDSEE
ncbi:LolA family protein [Coraliomargarita sp. W4R53]